MKQKPRDLGTVGDAGRILYAMVCTCSACSKSSTPQGWKDGGPMVAHIVTHLIFLTCLEWEGHLITPQVDRGLLKEFESLGSVALDPTAVEAIRGKLASDGVLKRVHQRALAALNNPKQHKTGEIALQTVTMSITEVAKSMVDNAWNSLSEEEKADLRKRVAHALSKNLQSGQLEPRLRETMMNFVVGMVEKELEARTEEIRAKVAAEVDARWAEQIEKVVQAKVDQAIARVKQEILAPR